MGINFISTYLLAFNFGNISLLRAEYLAGQSVKILFIFILVLLVMMSGGRCCHIGQRVVALVTAASGREARRFTREDFASIIRIAKVITADIRVRGPGTLLA